MTTYHGQDFTGAEFRDCDFSRARFLGIEMADVEITGELARVTVNGVDVMPLVETELDRRHPVRPLLRSEEPAELREGWRQLCEEWATTQRRIADLTPEQQRQQVDGEWSSIETLRHLVYATDAWVRRAVLAEPEPIWSAALAWTTDYEDAGIGIDPDADPTLAEVLDVRAGRVAAVTALLEAADDRAALAAPATGATGPGWPTADMELTVGECLRVVLNEEFWHHQYCLRDLGRLGV